MLVFVMVLTSLDEKNSMHLMRAEVPGPEADKLVPKARGTARILYGMYFALTTIEVVFLLAGGMNLFDAVTHASVLPVPEDFPATMQVWHTSTVPTLMV